MPPEISTFLIGMTPVGEIRAAIPLGITQFGLSSLEAFFWGFLGNLLVVVVIVSFLPILTRFAQKHSKLLDEIFQKIFARTRKRHSKNFLRFGALSLILFVAVPLPGSGGYTGSLVAWLFGVKPRLAIPLIALGIFLAGLIVLGITNGSLSILRPA